MSLQESLLDRAFRERREALDELSRLRAAVLREVEECRDVSTSDPKTPCVVCRRYKQLVTKDEQATSKETT